MASDFNVLMECVAPKEEIDKHGCNYITTASGGEHKGKYFCNSFCCRRLVQRIVGLEDENRQLKNKLHEVVSEV